MPESIAVLGGGNCAQAMAADMARAGRDVVLYELPRFTAAIEPVLRTGDLVLSEHGRTETVRVRATTDVVAALKAARLVNVVVPAHAHDAFFEAMLPHLRHEHVVVVWSGRLGSLRLAALLRAADLGAPTIAEVNTLAYGARLDGPGRPQVLYRARRMAAATLPATGAAELCETLATLYPDIPIEHAGTVLGAALRNSSLLVLPTGAILNAGAIDAATGPYFLERDGLTRHVTRVVGAVNREFAAVGAAYGVDVPVYEDAVLHGPGSVESANFRGDHDGALLELSGPDAVDHRYLRENVPFGFVPIAALGQAAGVPTPVLDGLVAVARAMLGPGLREGERDLPSLGLAGLTTNDILRRLGAGE